ncbi:hypothetical protein PTSG_03888 [Salpingoeca rosetta]|uniref:Uncharacterized protein n=1 Tax=Salpingoeca rosetta (strain ATCC 50818 / BSB-021) TaxID=946362 RepID=F2U5P2_SALR5|nr:uncharacterized protein PTSG_03888 [Salpingoeca rosetta]EGD83258.1 hypothetical protein PTSG_03888 [Salpingoeca rosetta]|eukprot:XP_004995622.1 hypothetical protein PTSG_03888 [Salpingoeca rosetta]
MLFGAILTVYVECNRVQSAKDLLDPTTRLNEVTMEMKEKLPIRAGTAVQATQVTANSRGSGDVIEVVRNMSVTMRIGYYVVHKPVNGSLVYSTARCLNGFEGGGVTFARSKTHCVHVQTPADTDLGSSTPIYLTTPAANVSGTPPDTNDGGSFYVPLFSQTTASLGCAKLLPLMNTQLVNGEAPSGQKVIGYEFGTDGVGIVGAAHSSDDTLIAPYFKKVTLTLPKGNYSPTDITSILNRQLSKANPVVVEDPEQPGTTSHHLTYPYHTSLRTVYRGTMQCFTDEIPASVSSVYGISRDPNNAEGKPLPIKHWYLEDTFSAGGTPYPYSDYGAKFIQKPVRLDKDHSYFIPCILGGLTPAFSFDTNNSRFTLTGLHQSFSESDFEEIAYPDSQVIESNGVEKTNRISIAAQAALGVDYTRANGAFEKQDYAKPTQADGTDAMCVVGMVDPSMPKAGAITHWNGCFILSWYENEEELEFWNVLGFSNSDVVGKGPQPSSHAPIDGTYHYYTAKDLFDQCKQARTDERIDDALFAGRYPNTLGNTIYEPPFQQTFSLQRALSDTHNTAPSGTNPPIPMYRGDPDDDPSNWSTITLQSYEHLFNMLVSSYYWWFAPPFFKKQGSAEKFDPMAANVPSATNTRFVVSTKHEPIRASSLPRKLQFPDMLLVSDLPIYPSQRHFLSSGQPCNVLATLSKTYDTGDYFTSNSPGPQFTINEETSMHTQLTWFDAEHIQAAELLEKLQEERGGQLELEWRSSGARECTVTVHLRRGDAVPKLHRSELRGSATGIQGCVEVKWNNQTYYCGRGTTTTLTDRDDVVFQFASLPIHDIAHNAMSAVVLIAQNMEVEVCVYDFERHAPESFVLARRCLCVAALFRTPRRFMGDAVHPLDNDDEWTDDDDDDDDDDDMQITRQSSIVDS